ncbi:uncharacterized protein LOC111599929 isoform X1 [Drosophila hydei]|uniref:Uncharacterized protein LOC111599929 isoform X1 n=1 Tax=Drosophila hydei TaxID=7224 RepID=A0A6J1LWC9_DROHY|nr:uncharacterized protein LOC111599929 isoform X1 [Drosophila hydei]
MHKADKQAKAEQAQTGKSKAKAKANLEEAGAAAAAAAAADAGQQLIQEQDQTQELESPKAKARSRFSAAFRSLKTKKQEKEQPKPSSAEQLTAISSGEGEDLTSLGELSLDSELKASQKKKSLTRRLLLGSLKPKTKERPHSLATSDELSLKSSSSSRERALGTGLGSSNTLKITISGKKVETVEGKAKGKGKGKSETDYLTPIPIPIPTPTAIEEATAATAATAKPTTATTKETTKLIVAKVVPKEQPKQKKQTKQQLRATPQTEEKIVITESRRDTPPRERAPAKPSRASSHQSANSAGDQHKSSGASKALSLPSREKRALMQQQPQQQQQQRGHRLNKGSNTAALEKQALVTPPSSELQPAPAPASSKLELRPPSPPTSSTLVLVSLAESSDAVSLAESAQASVAPVVRFAVGSAVRGPDAYEAALAAAANQQPSSSEEPSDSSLRRLSFKQQLALSDHDSIEGRRETVRYQSVASEYGEEDQDTGDEQEEDDKLQLDKDSKLMPAFGNLTMDQEMEPTIMSPSGEKREHLYKILVIGELGTGKTSFIKRYVHQFFSQNYRATIGVDFALKVLHWDANTIVRLQLWDIAGQERFGNMTRVYYKEAVGAFIVFDVTRSGTFDCVSKWKEDLDSKVQLPDGSPIPCILLANKCDQEKQGIVTQPERMDEYVRENGFAGWFETSAKENINIDEAARALVNKILINDKLITADANDADKFNLSAADASAETKNRCSC